MASLKNVFVKQNLAHPKEQYSAMTAYANSKLYNIITAKASIIYEYLIFIYCTNANAMFKPSGKTT